MLRQQQQQEELRFPPISKTHRFKLLKDVTQQPYRVELICQLNFPIERPWYSI